MNAQEGFPEALGTQAAGIRRAPGGSDHRVASENGPEALLHDAVVEAASRNEKVAASGTFPQRVTVDEFLGQRDTTVTIASLLKGSGHVLSKDCWCNPTVEYVPGRTS